MNEQKKLFPCKSNLEEMKEIEEEECQVIKEDYHSSPRCGIRARVVKKITRNITFSPIEISKNPYFKYCVKQIKEEQKNDNSINISNNHNNLKIINKELKENSGLSIEKKETQDASKIHIVEEKANAIISNIVNKKNDLKKKREKNNLQFRKIRNYMNSEKLTKKIISIKLKLSLNNELEEKKSNQSIEKNNYNITSNISNNKPISSQNGNDDETPHNICSTKLSSNAENIDKEKDNTNDNIKDSTKDKIKENTNENTKENTKENAKDNAKDNIKDSIKDFIKDIHRDNNKEKHINNTIKLNPILNIHSINFKNDKEKKFCPKFLKDKFEQIPMPSLYSTNNIKKIKKPKKFLEIENKKVKSNVTRQHSFIPISKIKKVKINEEEKDKNDKNRKRHSLIPKDENKKDNKKIYLNILRNSELKNKLKKKNSRHKKMKSLGEKNNKLIKFEKYNKRNENETCGTPKRRINCSYKLKMDDSFKDSENNKITDIPKSSKSKKRVSIFDTESKKRKRLFGEEKKEGNIYNKKKSIFCNIKDRSTEKDKFPIFKEKEKEKEKDKIIIIKEKEKEKKSKIKKLKEVDIKMIKKRK